MPVEAEVNQACPLPTSKSFPTYLFIDRPKSHPLLLDGGSQVPWHLFHSLYQALKKRAE